jgi:hypothetical protein
MSRHLYCDRHYPIRDPFEPFDEDFYEGDLEAHVWDFYQQVISDTPPPIRPETFALLSTPLRLRSFRSFQILEFDPSMFLAIIFAADTDYTLDLWSSLSAAQLIAFSQQPDLARRGPAHFAAAAGVFQELFTRADELSLPDILSAGIVERDAHGLLPIHYAICHGLDKDVHFLAQFGEGYLCLTHDANRYSLLDLALQNCRFKLITFCYHLILFRFFNRFPFFHSISHPLKRVDPL